MDCPVCKNKMKPEKIETVWVDVCDEHGIWLDRGEIDELMLNSKKRGQAESFVSSAWSQFHKSGW